MPGRFRTRAARGRIVRLARPRCGVRMCADLRWSPPTLEAHHSMTNRRSTRVKGHHRLRMVLDTAITLCAEHAVDRLLEPGFPADARPFPHPSRSRAYCTSRAPALRCADVCGFTMVPADLGSTPQYDQSAQYKSQRTPPPPSGPGYRHHPLRRARRSPSSGAGFAGRCPAVSAPVSLAGVLYVSRAHVAVYGCVRIYDGPHHLGRTPSSDQSAQHLGNSVPRYPTAEASHSAASTLRLPSFQHVFARSQRTRPRTTASRPRGATGRRPDMALVRHHQRLRCPPGRDCHRPSPPPAPASYFPTGKGNCHCRMLYMVRSSA